MHRLFLLLAAVLTVSLGVALIAQAGATSTGTEFRTPDAGAACRLAATELVCSSLGSARSVALPATGTPVSTTGLPWWDASTPVLRHWRHGTLSCRLDRATIICRNAHAAVLASPDGFAVAG
jgi:hypothetical protein